MMTLSNKTTTTPILTAVDFVTVIATIVVSVALPQLRYAGGAIRTLELIRSASCEVSKTISTVLYNTYCLL